ncbi:MAG: hypothetical protein QOF65_2081 [Thermoleophilaceae bacterium]|jgi:hypothetical protein|nr:hypothetical protein [Thermoleophilaceae bacterium]MEA2437525.1 hypothetical protein [Thermoleophilaceae bacterium]
MQIPPPFRILLVIAASLALAACGSSSKDKKSTTGASAPKPSALAISISGSGKKASFTAPASVKGGVVELTFHNQGKQPHSAQLALLTGNHTPAELLKTLNASKGPPAWVHLVGGASGVGPGQTGTATVALAAGNYIVVDFGGGPGSGNGPPATKTFKVTGGAAGPLPSTSTTVTATAPAKDKYKWQINGPLKAGANRLTFVSKGGPDAVHIIAAARLKGKVTDAQIQKALKSNGPPPPFVDQSSFVSTSVLDRGRSEVTSLALQKPGEYVLFCPLTDRDGGKSHDQEGLLTRVTVK